MDQGIDKSKPPETSYRETFRRHRKRLCTPIILGALAAALFLFGMGRTYTSTASLWVDTAAPLPSSIGAGGSALSQPPASTAQAILSELLTTTAFSASVADTALGKSAGSTDATQGNAITLPGNGQVAVTVPGGQVLQISYSASSPVMAQRVLRALVTQLRDYTSRLNARHDQATVAYDRQQAKAAETALAAARSNVTAYQERHLGATSADPNYASLVAAENNATTQLSQANTALNQAGNAQGWSMQVTDPASQASTAPLRKSKLVEVIFAGMLGGALVSFLAVVALTPAKKESWDDELPMGRALVPDVPPADPFLDGSPRVPTAPARSTPAATGAGELRLLLAEGRYQFRTRSARSEEQ